MSVFPTALLVNEPLVLDAMIMLDLHLPSLPTPCRLAGGGKTHQFLPAAGSARRAVCSTLSALLHTLII